MKKGTHTTDSANQRVAYHKPALVHFGELKDLTQAGSGPQNENGTKKVGCGNLEYKPNQGCIGKF